MKNIVSVNDQVTATVVAIRLYSFRKFFSMPSHWRVSNSCGAEDGGGYSMMNASSVQNAASISTNKRPHIYVKRRESREAKGRK